MTKQTAVRRPDELADEVGAQQATEWIERRAQETGFAISLRG